MSDQDIMVYVSCAENQEINRFSMNRNTGALTLQETTIIACEVPPGPPETMNGTKLSYAIPLALSPDRRFLYGVLRAAPFRVISYAIDAGSGMLRQIGDAPIPEYTPFICVAPNGRFLIGNAYHGSFLWVSAIEDDGKISGPPIQIVENITNSHATLMHPRKPLSYIAVTGADIIQKLAFDPKTGRFERDGSPPVPTEPGTRPRHMALSPNDKFLYCISEKSAAIDCYRIDEFTDKLTYFQTIEAGSVDSETMPGTGADLHISTDGRFLYGSERGNSSISVYAIAPDSGALSHIQLVKVANRPRSFSIDPTGRFLIAAGLNSDRIGVYSIDQTSGLLTHLASHDVAIGPSWVECVDLADNS